MRFLRSMCKYAVFLVAAPSISGIGNSVVQAAPRQAPVNSTIHHDLSHPALVNLPCPGASRSGVGPQTSTSCSAASASGKLGNIPLADSPIGQYCANGIGYRQGEKGAYGWLATQQGLTVYVEYWWCPTNSAHHSEYPNGINWSYGTVRDAASSGCVWGRVGNWAGGGSTNNFDLGALISGSSSHYEDDGENNDETTNNPPTYSICAGDPNSYIWDYSKVGDGTFAWRAQMSGGVETYNSSLGHYYLTQLAVVYSPLTQ